MRDLDLFFFFFFFCRKASLPFPGEMDLGSGITFEILPMFVHGSFKIYYNIYKKKYIATILKTDIMSSIYNEKYMGATFKQ